MIVSIHQLQYLPYPGIFDKIDRSDVFIFLDHVQYVRSEWQNRNRIKTAQGQKFLTVPVVNNFGQSIMDVEIDNKSNPKWQYSHIETLLQCYNKAPYKTYLEALEAYYGVKYEKLDRLSADITFWMIRQLGLMRGRQFYFSSDLLGKGNELKSTDMLIALIKAVGGTTYLAGEGSANYMDPEQFGRHHILLTTQKFKCPTYKQLYGEFIPNLSMIDMLLNCGSDTMKLIRQENGREQSYL